MTRDAAGERYAELTYDEALRRELKVMDATAMVMCKEHHMPLKVFNMFRPGELMRVMCGEPVGTTVTS